MSCFFAVEEVKDRWGKLRNCFTNALKRRRKKSSQSNTKIMPWKFEKQMQFLLPFVEVRGGNATNLSPIECDINDEDSNPEFKYFEMLSTPASTSKTDPISPMPTLTPMPSSSVMTMQTTVNDDEKSLLKDMLNVLKSSHEIRQKRNAEMDETDYFFLSMSKQLKKLPETDQSQIKFHLHKLIYDAEIKMLNSYKHNET